MPLMWVVLWWMIPAQPTPVVLPPSPPPMDATLAPSPNENGFKYRPHYVKPISL